jgi:hypothetical protein
LDIIIDCQNRISTSPHYLEANTRIYKEIEELLKDIASSIPFLLAADLQVFLDNATKGESSLVPGKPVGGLLLMHSLYVLSTLAVVDPKFKVYIRDCLAWIGEKMCIGQATVLSKVRYDRYKAATGGNADDTHSAMQRT